MTFERSAIRNRVSQAATPVVEEVASVEEVVSEETTTDAK